MITQANLFAGPKDLLNNQVLDVTGSGAPVSGTSGTGVGICGPGSTYRDTVTGFNYANFGTLASPNWFVVDALNGVQIATGTISSATITSAAAGGLANANGVILVAAPGANIALYPIMLIASYKFSVAAYTGGAGNVSLNYGAGGAAITGVVTGANFEIAASDKPVVFVPLATAGVALVANASLNLVSTVAPTQPGTAAGVIFWKMLYTIQNLNTQV